MLYFESVSQIPLLCNAGLAEKNDKQNQVSKIYVYDLHVLNVMTQVICCACYVSAGHCYACDLMYLWGKV